MGVEGVLEEEVLSEVVMVAVKVFMRVWLANFITHYK